MGRNLYRTKSLTLMPMEEMGVSISPLVRVDIDRSGY